jgi:hypothetical protein
VTRKPSLIFPLNSKIHTFSISITETKIDKANRAIIVNKQILRLEIAMNNVEFVNILNTSDDLLKDGASFFL